MANKDKTRVDELTGFVVIDAPLTYTPALDPSADRPRHIPSEEEQVQEQGRQEQKPEQDCEDLAYEQVLKEAYTGYKEEPPPKPDFEIVDEGRTEKNPYEKTGAEEIFK